MTAAGGEKLPTISEIEELLKKITPGPWLNDYTWNSVTDSSPSHGYTFDKLICTVKTKASDSQFIALAPTIARMMLAYRNGWAKSLCEYDQKVNRACMQEGKYHEAVDDELRRLMEKEASKP